MQDKNTRKQLPLIITLINSINAFVEKTHPLIPQEQMSQDSSVSKPSENDGFTKVKSKKEKREEKAPIDIGAQVNVKQNKFFEELVQLQSTYFQNDPQKSISDAQINKIKEHFNASDISQTSFREDIQNYLTAALNAHITNVPKKKQSDILPVFFAQCKQYGIDLSGLGDVAKGLRRVYDLSFQEPRRTSLTAPEQQQASPPFADQNVSPMQLLGAQLQEILVTNYENDEEKLTALENTYRNCLQEYLIWLATLDANLSDKSFQSCIERCKQYIAYAEKGEFIIDPDYKINEIAQNAFETILKAYIYLGYDTQDLELIDDEAIKKTRKLLNTARSDLVTAFNKEAQALLDQKNSSFSDQLNLKQQIQELINERTRVSNLNLYKKFLKKTDKLNEQLLAAQKAIDLEIEYQKIVDDYKNIIYSLSVVQTKPFQYQFINYAALHTSLSDLATRIENIQFEADYFSPALKDVGKAAKDDAEGVLEAHLNTITDSFNDQLKNLIFLASEPELAKIDSRTDAELTKVRNNLEELITLANSSTNVKIKAKLINILEAQKAINNIDFKINQEQFIIPTALEAFDNAVKKYNASLTLPISSPSTQLYQKLLTQNPLPDLIHVSSLEHQS